VQRAEIERVLALTAAVLVVLEADPLADIRNTRRIRLVIKDGRLWRPAELLTGPR